MPLPPAAAWWLLMALQGGPSAAPPAPPPVLAPVLAPGPAPAVPGASQADAVHQAPVVGGFSTVRPGDDALRPAVRAALAALTPNPRARNRARVLSAERQVVAGSNYRLLLQLRDGSRWRVIVWQKLDGTCQVTETVRAEA